MSAARDAVAGDTPARRTSVGEVETVHTFDDQMPTGVAVSDGGRIFISFPRWGDDVAYTVAELVDGEERPFPSAELQQFDRGNAGERLVSVQSVVIDPLDRLWLLDTGSVEFEPVIPGAPKLVCVDLETDEIVRTIHFPEDVALEKTYLNDVRFDLRRGEEGAAFITDSSEDGPAGLIVVDLASGDSRRRLTDHPTTKAVEGYLGVIEGQPLAGLAMQTDGIAISGDGERLFYCPFASRRLYSVAVEALLDDSLDDDGVAETIRDHGEKGASDGLETDAAGTIYATNYEHGAVIRREGEQWRPLAHTPEMRFIDTLAVAADGFLYFTNNQLWLQPTFQGGEDRREPPYSLMRTAIDADRLRLR